MSRHLCLLALAIFPSLGWCSQDLIAIPSPPKGSDPVPNDLESFSIEFAFFPDYAGNKSYPNAFSKILLENLEDITGKAPKIRVGGTSQDHAMYYPDQEDSIELIFKNPTDDQPTIINYGPAFFESYHTLGNLQYIHGLNFNENGSDSISQLESAAVEACKSIGSGLHLFELGNEINFAPGTYRASNYSMFDYVEEWNNKTEIIAAAVEKACPGPFPGYMAPSFVLVNFIPSSWSVEEIFTLGYDPHNLTKEISVHNYLSVFLPGYIGPVNDDLQSILMNHTSVVNSLAPHIVRAERLAYLGHEYTLGETNSIAGQGRNGESNVFGDALWLVDYSLWAGAHNIKRLHFHQGLNYRYASWQPIPSKGVPPTTRPPYYGQIMVAKMLGRSENNRIANIPLVKDTESAYAVYDGDRLSKLAVINLQLFLSNTTTGRPSRGYKFQVPKHYRGAKVERLTAPGGDVTANITFGGISYDYDLNGGKPISVVPRLEMLDVVDGVLSVDVPDSSAVLLTLV